MHTTNKNHVEQVVWHDIRTEVQAVNADLARKLDEVAARLGTKKKGGQATPPLFTARYAYGQLLVRDGEFVSPCAGEGLAPCASCKALNNSVVYSHIPLTLVLDKCVEVYLEYKDRNRTAPLRLVQTGDLFGVFETLDAVTEGKSESPPSWNVSSGARSVLVVAPVSNDDLKRPLAQTLSRHANDIPWNKMKQGNWALIRELAKLLDSDWKANVLVFPEAWVRGNDGESTLLLDSIFKLGWQQSRYLRDVAAKETLCGTSRTTRLDDHKTIMHLLPVAKGDVPGFRPVTSPDSEAGPFCKIQTLLAYAFEKKATNNAGEIKGKIHTPEILQPCHLVRTGEAVYYSFSRPSIPWPITKGHSHADDGQRIWDTLKEIKEDAYLDAGKTQHFVAGSSKYGALDVVQEKAGGHCFEPVRQKSGSGNLEKLPVSDFYAAGLKDPTKIKLSLRSSSGEFFFSACLRIVRK